ncbi:hypothetical protein [Oxynema aestuarii]|jgi:hypothetical protein|uniref:Uncharacterized protein n=1 Tax=Oxynema aestuarii AP17 TaxID=2064643 RepID=A0A6H1TY40_9CYAN|nr:hypothetical protein [Oxynema aestuarii]QIZ70279.1 hypothetical protein HCG48_06565 [Oxynema aestuarii AP17]RMH73423.1 MAG: hypothetical protein D6680_16640 [Cyanobacteria bacterium J007]
MNQGSPKIFSLDFLTDVSRWVVPFLVIWFLGSIGLGWLVNSILIFLGLLMLTPVIAFLGLRWWLGRNLVIGSCPVCSYQLTGLKRTELQCPSCGEPLRVEGEGFERLTPPGTVDVEAVEVSATPIDESRSS